MWTLQNSCPTHMSTQRSKVSSKLSCKSDISETQGKIHPEAHSPAVCLWSQTCHVLPKYKMVGGAQDTHSQFKEERREGRKEWQSQPCGSTGGWSCPSKPRWRQPCAQCGCTPWAQHGCCQSLLPVPQLHLPAPGAAEEHHARVQVADTWCQVVLVGPPELR